MEFEKPYAYHESVFYLEICQWYENPCFDGATVSLDRYLQQIPRWKRYNLKQITRPFRSSASASAYSPIFEQNII
jgi:hypothetical protein